MKITSKQYAQALYEIVVDGKKDEVKVAITKLITTVKANKDITKLDKIVLEFVKIWNKEKGIVEAEITVAHELDKKTKEAVANYVGELAGAGEAQIKEMVDKDILGGLIIKYGDKVRDVSLRASLIALKEAMAS